MKSVNHEKTFELAVPVEELFPLFSPEGEKLWVPGWDYRNVMGTPDLAEDYVFITETHDHATAEAIWVVKKYDPEAWSVEFYKIEPGDKVGVVRVKCNSLGERRTEVEVGYKYIALSAGGEAFVRSFTAAVYHEFIGEWHALLSKHFELGPYRAGPSVDSAGEP